MSGQEVRRQYLTNWRVTGRLRIGHTRDFSDKSEMIVVREADDMMPPPGGLGYVDLRCEGCVAKPHLAIGEDQTLMVLEHEAGCGVLVQLLAEAGVDQ